MRLNRYIAHSGLTSRRKADDFISAGSVTVNGEVTTDFSAQVSNADVVEVNGKRIQTSEATIVALYKPIGVTTTKSDPHADVTITDILPEKYQALNPAGRLDRESEGLLIVTNDGELAQQLTHPSFEHEKEYEVEVEKNLTDADLQQLADGVKLKEGVTARATVQRLGRKRFSITITQGWKRQIRRMVESVQNSVTILKRTRIGKLSLGDMKPGDVKEVNKEDII